jgi:hypothetical protein
LLFLRLLYAAAASAAWCWLEQVLRFCSDTNDAQETGGQSAAVAAATPAVAGQVKVLHHMYMIALVIMSGKQSGGLMKPSHQGR